MRMITICSDTLPDGKIMQQAMWQGFTNDDVGVLQMDKDINNLMQPLYSKYGIGDEVKVPVEMSVEDQINFHLDALKVLRDLQNIKS